MNVERKIYGVQFHPEVNLTVNGHIIISNFLRKIVGFSSTYTIMNREKMCIDKIREIVSDKKVLVMFLILLLLFKKKLLDYGIRRS